MENYQNKYIIGDNGKIGIEIHERIWKAGKIYNELRNTFLEKKKKEVPKEVRLEVYKKVAWHPLVYGGEGSTMTGRSRSKITASKMRILRKIKGITKKRYKQEPNRYS